MRASIALRGRDVALCVAAYLYGSIPLVYLLARRRRVDLKRTGSGNVGATNLRAATGAAQAAAGWVFDASKGLVPILAGRRFGYTEEVAELAGVCGVAGQCWPLFLRLRGGRGISAFVGATFLINRRAWLAAILPMIAGGLWRIAPPAARSGGTEGPQRAGRGKSVPLGCLVGVLAFPLACAGGSTSPRRKVQAALLAVLLVGRRVTAASPDDIIWGPGMERRAFLNRLLYDRNTSN